MLDTPQGDPMHNTHACFAILFSPLQAVLFYSMLPDGNLDDFSQHAALAPRKGEKWLINLWVWDPFFPR